MGGHTCDSHGMMGGWNEERVHRQVANTHVHF